MQLQRTPELDGAIIARLSKEHGDLNTAYIGHDIVIDALKAENDALKQQNEDLAKANRNHLDLIETLRAERESGKKLPKRH